MVNSCHRFLTDPLLRNPVFLFCLSAYLVFRSFMQLVPEAVPYLVRNYLADLLCLPIVLTLAVLIQRHVVLRNPAYRLNKWQVLFAFAYFSVLFELVFPVYYSRYTSDGVDVLAYALGALVYWACINPRTENGAVKST